MKVTAIVAGFALFFLSIFFILLKTGSSEAQKLSPELSIHNYSFFGNFKSKAIAASCGFTLENKVDEYSGCTLPNGCPGISQCGGVCSQPTTINRECIQYSGDYAFDQSCYGYSDCPANYTGQGAVCVPNTCGCTNGATNPPSCNQCASGSTWNGSNCTCNNGASNSPQCNTCPSGLTMQNNLCVCANGATNAPTCNICPAGSNMQNGQCVCTNNADVFQGCNACRAGQIFDNNGYCRDRCNFTNVCGQTKEGVMVDGSCKLSSDENPNTSCIATFNVTTNTVNPNGSVEFSWSLANTPSNIRSVCGFVDLTTPTPRPIPGLQNLDPTTDRARINNIQTSTRFCLVCKYYSLLNNNALLGEAVKHQWVRVLRVTEN